MGEVIKANIPTVAPIPVRSLLDGAADLKTVIVIGYDANDELYLASSVAEAAEINWLIERAKRRLMKLIEPD